MSSDSESETSVTPHQGKTVHHEEEHQLQVLLQKVIGEDNLNLSERQIDEILAQRKEVNKYIYDERMQRHDRFKISEKNKLHYFYGSSVLVVLIAGAVLVYHPEYFKEVLALLFGFAGGFGVGRNTRRKFEE